MNEIVFDIETFHEYFYVGMKRTADGKRRGFEMSRRSPVGQMRENVRRIFRTHDTVGFNSLNYDLPMIYYFLEGADNIALKRASDQIINGRIRWWEVEDFLGIRIPWDVKKRHTDLIEPQPNAFASLKILNGRLHGKQLQELPFDPDHVPTDEDIDTLNHYCLYNDLDGTELLLDALREPLKLRDALGKEYENNFRSKSDSQIGEAIVKKRVEAITGRKPKKIETRPGTIFKYDVPEFMHFETPQLQDILERLRDAEFMIGDAGKVIEPSWLKNLHVTIGTTTYSMGIGGLHSTESNRAVKSSDTHVLIDADVASQYPSIIMMLGLAPKSLGKDFLSVYGAIKTERLIAKRAKDKVKDKGLKIALNGVYGKLGSRYSILYAPHLLIAVTLTGQLTLLMLIEQAEKQGIPVVSGNTDGVVFRCPREKFAGIENDFLVESALSKITSAWEKTTGFVLEFNEYKAIYNQSVNSYFAIKADGSHKRKGPIGNPWSADKSDNDPRAQLMKNPQMTICSDAALALIKDDIPVTTTIRACTDMRQFITIIKASKGATWRGDYLGKVVRYYWATDGEEIFGSVPHPTTGNYKKIPKTDGAFECMALPDAIPDNLDYGRYIAETEKILTELGYYGPIIQPVKPIRITKVNRKLVLSTWAVSP